jgi:hypothetical protein
MMTNLITAIGLTILCAIVFFIGFVFGLGEALKASKKNKKKSKYPKCDCKDVNDCGKWCNAKHLFKKASDRGLV